MENFIRNTIFILAVIALPTSLFVLAAHETVIPVHESSDQREVQSLLMMTVHSHSQVQSLAIELVEALVQGAVFKIEESRLHSLHEADSILEDHDLVWEDADVSDVELCVLFLLSFYADFTEIREDIEVAEIASLRSSLNKSHEYKFRYTAIVTRYFGQDVADELFATEDVLICNALKSRYEGDMSREDRVALDLIYFGDTNGSCVKFFL